MRLIQAIQNKEFMKRNTVQKQLIYAALCSADHPTATELYDILRAENPKLSLGTVYRVLSQFADDGRVIRLGSSDEPSRYDATLTPHAHAHCVICGRVFDLSDDEISAVLKKSPQGFKVLSSKVEYTGVCGDCGNAEN